MYIVDTYIIIIINDTYIIWKRMIEWVSIHPYINNDH
jgi:hypothetical protein